MRAKRVKFFKRMIISFLAAGILLPNILCVLLFYKVHGLEDKIEELYTKVANETAVSVEAAATASLQAGMDYTTEEEVKNGVLEDETLAENNQQESVSDHKMDAARKVYLTFDDGPSKYTGEILDILAEYHVKATFFVVGKEDEYSKSMYKRIVAEGHSIGMHSYSHKYNEIYASADNYFNDLEKLQNYIYEVTGVKPDICRFPGGSSNLVSKVPMQELIDGLEERNIVYHDWNVSSGDATSDVISAEEILKNCTNLEGYRQATILMHDANDKRTTVEALPLVIAQILEMDDTVIGAITEDTYPVQHKRN